MTGDERAAAPLGEQVGDGAVDVVLGRLRGGEPGDERRRVVDVLRGGQHVGVRPERIPRVGPDGVADLLPHRGGFTQAPRSKLEPDQGGEGRLSRSAGRAATAHRLGDRAALGQSGGGARRDHIDPALDESELRLEPGERRQLLLALRRDERAAGHGIAQLVGVARVELGRQVLDLLRVDVDAVREVGDLRDQLQAKPLGVPEQPGVRQFAHRQVDAHLVEGDVEAGAEGVDVLRHDDRLALVAVAEGNADVAARDHLGGELPDDLAELHREQRAAHVAQQLRRVGTEHPGRVVGEGFVEHLRQGVRDRGRDRLGELRPHRHRRLGPAGAVQQHRLLGEAGDVGGLVEPQRGDVQCGLERGALVGGAGNRAPRRERRRLLESQIPVDAVGRVGQRVLQLADQSGDERRIGGEARGARELRGVHVSVAGEELAQHFAEVVVVGRFRLIPRIIRHANYANRWPVAPPGFSP